MYLFERQIIKHCLKRVYKKGTYTLTFRNSVLFIDECLCKGYIVYFSNNEPCLAFVRRSKLDQKCLIILHETYADEYVFIDKNSIYHIHSVRNSNQYVVANNTPINYQPINEEMLEKKP